MYKPFKFHEFLLLIHLQLLRHGCSADLVIQKDASWNFDSQYCEAFNILKKAFVSVPILTYWIPNTQIIMETNVSDYTLAAILLIMIEEKEVHLVVFHSCMFKAAKLSYDIYNKELLIVIMNHKNLEYFLTTKILSHHQLRWLEFLFQFNLIIYFYLGHLEFKSDYHKMSYLLIVKLELK